MLTIAGGILLAIVLFYVFTGLLAGTVGGVALMEKNKGCGCLMAAFFGILFLLLAMRVF
jgi:hypothetical protein